MQAGNEGRQIKKVKEAVEGLDFPSKLSFGVPSYDHSDLPSDRLSFSCITSFLTSSRRLFFWPAWLPKHRG
jgi:hypothetical protein